LTNGTRGAAPYPLRVLVARKREVRKPRRGFLRNPHARSANPAALTKANVITPHHPPAIPALAKRPAFLYPNRPSMLDPESPAGRRPLKSRQLPLFQKLAERLARDGIAPNTISFCSLVFSAAAGLAFAITAHSPGWLARIFFLAAAVFIQLRLICNLLDGMVAVEHQRKSPAGDLWNEVPDRFSDVATIVGAGYALGGHPLLGFIGAILALLTAYVRALGASIGAGQIFAGIGGKPQRMFLLTVTAVAMAVLMRPAMVTFGLTLVCIAAGATVAQRLKIIRNHLYSTR
jgi:phosphatidylglycerophosphate synthase